MNRSRLWILAAGVAGCLMALWVHGSTEERPSRNIDFPRDESAGERATVSPRLVGSGTSALPAAPTPTGLSVLVRDGKTTRPIGDAVVSVFRGGPRGDPPTLDLWRAEPVGEAVRTDARGAAPLGLPATEQAVMVQVSAPGYLIRRRRLPSPLPVGDRIVIDLDAGVRVTGTVSDLGGAPLEGARVHFVAQGCSVFSVARGLAQDTRWLQGSAAADAQGRFELYVRPGSYELLAQHEQCYQAEVALLRVEADGAYENPELRLGRVRLVHVKLVDEQGAPVPALPRHVSLVGSPELSSANLLRQGQLILGAGVPALYPQMNRSGVGEYAFVAVPKSTDLDAYPDNAELAIAVPGYQPVARKVRLQQPPGAGQEAVQADVFRLRRVEQMGQGNLLLDVVQKPGSDGTAHSGRYVAGLSTISVSAPGYQATLQGEPTKSGTLRFRGLPAGIVRFRIDGDVSVPSKWTEVEIQDTETTDARLEVEISGVILDVRDESGRAVWGYLLFASPGDRDSPRYFALDPELGKPAVDASELRRFPIAALMPNAYRLLVQRDGFANAEVDVTVEPGKIQTVRVTLRPEDS